MFRANLRTASRRPRRLDRRARATICSGPGAEDEFPSSPVRGHRSEKCDDPDARRSPAGGRYLSPCSRRQRGTRAIPQPPDPDSLQQGRRRWRRPLSMPSAAMLWSPTTSAAATPAREPGGMIDDDPADGFDVGRVDRRPGMVRRQGRDLRHELPRRHSARSCRDESAASDHDGTDRFRIELRRQRNAARRRVRAALHELDFPDWRT